MNFIDIKTDEEISKLANLASEIWNEYWTIILSQEQIDYMVEKFQSFNSIKEQIHKNRYIYKILEVEDNLAGYFAVCPKHNYLFLSKLYLKKEYRHAGFGKLAFEKIKEIAKLNDKTSIQLTVNKNNKDTINAYYKWGFKTIDAVVTDIGNNFVMDDYIMEYKL